MMPSVNIKYKTTMCRHFEQTGYCHLGTKCHFAHGKGELRSIKDPLPAKNVSTSQQSTPKITSNPLGLTLPPAISNYKTVKCKYFEKGFCKFEQNCGFAHGNQEIRSSNSPLPQNILDATMPIAGNMMPSTYDSNQIAQKQIFYLISQMEGYHVSNQEILGKLKQATDMNTAGNVQSAASVVYNIINRKDKSQEDSDNYAIFVQNIQGLGSTLYQQMQAQFSQQASSLGLFGFNPQPMPTNPMFGMGTTPNLSVSPYPSHSHIPTMPQMEQQFGNQHYQQNSQGQVPNQDNNSIGMTTSMTKSMSKINMNNYQQGNENMHHYPSNMSMSSNGGSSKNFGN